MNAEQFFKQIEGTVFQMHFAESVNVNNGAMPLAMWNLIISIRDVKLFTKGIIPHRHWKFNVVKQYFGVTGNKEKVLEQLEQYNEIMKKIAEETKQAQLN